MNQIDTNTLIAICTCAIGLTQFLFWRYIAKQKTYESEKGKNLATKEDIRDITDSIKSVESKYNSSLELFKMELLNEHEYSKSLIEICNNLDKELINHLISCKNDIERDGSYDSEGRYGCAVSSITQLGDFLHSYESRYSSLKYFYKLLNKCDRMDNLRIGMENSINDEEPLCTKNYRLVTKEAQKYIKNTLKILIPPIRVSHTKKPEH